MGRISRLFGSRISRLTGSRSHHRLVGLQDQLQYRFSSTNLLDLALRHRSHVYANEKDGITSNERLEFLGDAVLDLIVTEDLFRRHPDKREGELTQIKSLLVSKAVLAQKSLEIGIGDFLYLSREEDLAGGRGRTSILGDAFEAILGAIYLDGGLEPAQRFIAIHLLACQDEITSDGSYLNFKSALLEHTQSEGRGHPRYLVHAEDGPDHRKTFTVEVLVAGDRVGLGQGRSKKEAQQMAAREALEKLGVE